VKTRFRERVRIAGGRPGAEDSKSASKEKLKSVSRARARLRGQIAQVGRFSRFFKNFPVSAKMGQSSRGRERKREKDWKSEKIYIRLLSGDNSFPTIGNCSLVQLQEV